jgi:glyoxylase-like metal-dependent hydrolase (beta-lactamase superfamily II)
MRTSLNAKASAIPAWGARADVARVVHDGETIALRARRLEAGFRPGHSPSDTVFDHRERRILVVGDHLLKHVSSNPLITGPRRGVKGSRPSEARGPHGRPQALVTDLESLGKTRDMDVELVLPGRARADLRSPRADRRARRRTRAPRRQGPPDLIAPASRLRAGSSGVGQRRPNIGLLNALGGAGPHRHPGG